MISSRQLKHYSMPRMISHRICPFKMKMIGGTDIVIQHLISAQCKQYCRKRHVPRSMPVESQRKLPPAAKAPSGLNMPQGMAEHAELTG